MRVLIVGGTGLTGPALARRLHADGHDVCLFARGRTPTPRHIPARLLAGDRTDPAALRAAFERASPDAVIDQIAFHGGAVDAIAAFSPARHIVCSSAAVLGEGLGLTEDAPTAPPQTPYLAGKLAVEARARACGAIVVRPAYLCGPGHAPLTVRGRDAELARKIRAGESIELPGDGELPLQPIFAADYAEAIARILAAPDPAPMYHLGGTPTTWRGWLEAVAAAAGAPLRVTVVPVERLTAENELFRDYLRHPLTIASRCLPPITFTPLAEGAAELVEWLDRVEA
jgi:nucleoside-diphosphate-sugar epimerase